MAVEDDQNVWRTVFCKDPTFCNVTTYPNDGTEHTVVQPDATKLLCTTTPDGTTAQSVIQSEANLLNVTSTPVAESVYPFSEGNRKRGIWPAPNSVRINLTGYAAGVETEIIYTVPASKILYIASSMMASRESANAASRCLLYVRLVNDDVKYFFSMHYYDIAGHQTTGQQHVPALEAVAGEDVVIQSVHANIDARAVFHGWLEDA